MLRHLKKVFGPTTGIEQCLNRNSGDTGTSGGRAVETLGVAETLGMVETSGKGEGRVAETLGVVEEEQWRPLAARITLSSFAH